jgi:hypothetical protein
MTKNRIAGAVSALALFAAPAVAIAHGNDDGGSHRHGRHHHHQRHVHKAKVREVTGTATGTVASFANRELTITLPNGKSFTADVKRRTVILCKSAPAATTARHGDDDGNSGPGRGGRDDGSSHDAGDDHGDHPATSTTPASTTAPPSTTVPAPTTGDDGANHDANDDHSNDDHNNGHGTRCGTAALVVGAKVIEAKLSLQGGNATWKKIELLK